jgi:mannose-6-phosphate isomerase-like protein (cupin superfamily)
MWINTILETDLGGDSYKIISLNWKHGAMSKERIEHLNTLIDTLDSQDKYFLDFVNSSGLQAGVLRISTDLQDTQEPHPVDELYYVIRGSGYIQVGNRDYFVKQGTAVFIPANAVHRFHSSADLVVLYILGGR